MLCLSLKHFVIVSAIFDQTLHLIDDKATLSLYVFNALYNYATKY